MPWVNVYIGETVLDKVMVGHQVNTTTPVAFTFLHAATGPSGDYLCLFTVKCMWLCFSLRTVGLKEVSEWG
jgi:hypothetical protein